MSILFVSSDLMFGSQVSLAARRAGASVQTAANVAVMQDQLAAEIPRLVVLDLGAVGAPIHDVVNQLQALEPRPTVIAYAPHVQDGMLDAAVRAGCDQVLTRGQFSTRMAELIGRYAINPLP